MSDKVYVKVFGIKDQSVSCGCSCGGDCGPSKTMGELYKDFADFLLKSKIKNRIDIAFVDILMDEMDGYKYALEAMDKGYGLPLTAINGKIRFYGGINNSMIYEAIRNS